MAMRVELFDDLDAVARDAAGRLDRALQPSLLDRLDWFRLTLAHCPPPGRLLVARAEEGVTAAWLFLMVDGRKAQALASWYSLRAGVQRVGGAAQHETVKAVAARLRRSGLASIALAPMGGQAAEVQAAFRAAGWIATDEPAAANWRVRVEGSDFDRFWAARPGRLRSTLRRKAKAAALDVNIYERFDGDAWADYEAVYAASWKPQEGSPAFLRALAEQEGAAGTLRLGIARKAGAPIAAQLWLVENGVATIHKLAHVASADALSPGTILSAAMFRHVIERDRPAWIDFGTGDDAYKADWMDERRTLRRLTFHNPMRLAGLAGAARARVAALVRRGASG